MSEHDRLRWRCRRGMLELDLILLRFLDDAYPKLTPMEQQSFEALLECQDDMLMSLIEGKEEAADARFLPLIERLRSC